MEERLLEAVGGGECQVSSQPNTRGILNIYTRVVHRPRVGTKREPLHLV